MSIKELFEKNDCGYFIKSKINSLEREIDKGHDLNSDSTKWRDNRSKVVFCKLPMILNQDTDNYAAAFSATCWQKNSSDASLLSGILRCPVCDKIFLTSVDLYQHVTKHHSSFNHNLPVKTNGFNQNKGSAKDKPLSKPAEFIYKHLNGAARMLNKGQDIDSFLTPAPDSVPAPAIRTALDQGTTPTTHTNFPESLKDSMKINLSLNSWLSSLSLQKKFTDPYLPPSLIMPKVTSGTKSTSEDSSFKPNSTVSSLNLKNISAASFAPSFFLAKKLSKFLEIKSLANSSNSDHGPQRTGRLSTDEFSNCSQASFCQDVKAPLFNKTHHLPQMCADQGSFILHGSVIEKPPENEDTISAPVICEPSSNGLSAKSIERHISRLISNNEKLLTNPDLEKVKPRRVFRRSSLDPTSLRSGSSNLSRFNSSDSSSSSITSIQDLKILEPDKTCQEQIAMKSKFFPDCSKVVELKRAPLLMSSTLKMTKNTFLNCLHSNKQIPEQTRRGVKRSCKALDLFSSKKKRRATFFECRNCGVRYRKEDNYKIHKKNYCLFKNDKLMIDKSSDHFLSEEENLVSNCEEKTKKKLSSSSDGSLNLCSQPQSFFFNSSDLKYNNQTLNNKAEFFRTKSAEGVLETNSNLVGDCKESLSMAESLNKNFLKEGPLLSTTSKKCILTHSFLHETKKNFLNDKSKNEKQILDVKNKSQDKSHCVINGKSDLFAHNEQKFNRLAKNDQFDGDKTFIQSSSLIPRSNYKLLVHQLSLRNSEAINSIAQAFSPEKAVLSFQQMSQNNYNEPSCSGTLASPKQTTITNYLTLGQKGGREAVSSNKTVKKKDNILLRNLSTHSIDSISSYTPIDVFAKRCVESHLADEKQFNGDFSTSLISNTKGGSCVPRRPSQRFQRTTPDSTGQARSQQSTGWNSNSVFLYPHIEAALRNETHLTFCSAISPQPAYMESPQNSLISMYSEWSVSEPFLIPPGLSIENVLTGWSRSIRRNTKGFFTCALTSKTFKLTTSEDYARFPAEAPKDEVEIKENFTLPISNTVKAKMNQQCARLHLAASKLVYASCSQTAAPRFSTNHTLRSNPNQLEEQKPEESKSFTTKKEVSGNLQSEVKKSSDVTNDWKGETRANRKSWSSELCAASRKSSPDASAATSLSINASELLMTSTNIQRMNCFVSQIGCNINGLSKDYTVINKPGPDVFSSPFLPTDQAPSFLPLDAEQNEESITSSTSFEKDAHSNCLKISTGSDVNSFSLNKQSLSCSKATNVTLIAGRDQLQPSNTVFPNVMKTAVVPTLPEPSSNKIPPPLAENSDLSASVTVLNNQISSDPSISKNFNAQNKICLSSTTTGESRPFRCQDCKVAFRVAGHLAKHLRSKAHALALQKKTFNQLKTAQCDEVEEKNFETAEGMKSTTSVSSAKLLLAAVEKSNRIEKEKKLLEGLPSVVGYADVSSRNDFRPYKCFVCNVAFMFQGHLDRHLRSNAHFVAANQSISRKPNQEKQPQGIVSGPANGETKKADDGKYAVSEQDKQKLQNNENPKEHNTRNSEKQ